ncbi:helix-turn-helix domain-containing protein [Escherichia coli]
MLIDTSSLPDMDDTAPWDDSGGEQKEKRPGGKDLGDEMESDNDTESNANIIAPDDGNINGNSGKNSSAVEEIRATKPINHSLWGLRSSARKPVAKATTEQSFDEWASEVAEANDEQTTQSEPTTNQSDDRTDWVKKMSALSEQLRNKDNDGWKQHESVPPAGIHEDIKKSDSGIAVREGKEFRQRDELIIESREITQTQQTQQQRQMQQKAPESTDKQGDKADSSRDNLDRVRSYRKFETERYVNDRLFDDGFLEVLTPSTVKVLMFIGSKCNSDGVCYHSHETMMQLTGLGRNTIKRSIAELVENKLIEVKAVDGKTNNYRLL